MSEGCVFTFAFTRGGAFTGGVKAGGGKVKAG